MAEESELLLEVNDLKMHFPIQKGLLRRTTGYVKAVDGVSLSIKKGETLGLVGESGCGKTTTGRCIVRVYQPTDGEIIFYDEGDAVLLNRLERQELKAFRRNMQMIFQDPFSSLNPRMTVLELVGEPLLAHGIARGQELEDRVAAMVAAVGLRLEHLPRYPHSFSGGQRQRIGIARALALEPDLLLCDEAVSALDVSIQAQVLNLLMDLQQQLGLTYLFIAHDLSVVRHISDRIGVMYLGRIVEVAERDELFEQPRHPYTEALLASVPTPDPGVEAARAHHLIAGEVPSVRNPPPGCRFHPRCPKVLDHCDRAEPLLEAVGPARVACHLYADSRPAVAGTGQAGDLAL